jgi:hypothetical protein
MLILLHPVLSPLLTDSVGNMLYWNSTKGQGDMLFQYKQIRNNTVSLHKDCLYCHYYSQTNATFQRAGGCTELCWLANVGRISQAKQLSEIDIATFKSEIHEGKDKESRRSELNRWQDYLFVHATCFGVQRQDQVLRFYIRYHWKLYMRPYIIINSHESLDFTL